MDRKDYELFAFGGNWEAILRFFFISVSENRLVKLVARAFYDDITTKGDNQPKSGRSDNRGIAVVVLDALTRYNRIPHSVLEIKNAILCFLGKLKTELNRSCV